jgi:phospholipid transport system substrate-binding protein
MCSVILAVRRCLLARIVQQLSVALFLTALLAASLATPAHAADDPTAGVKSLVERTLAIVHSKEMSLSAKRGEFRDMLERHFDLVGMARDSLEEHWPELNAAAQSKFSQAFNSLVADTYLGEIRDYDREQIQIVSQELRGANAEVSGSMRNSSDEVADLKFKLRNIEGQWKINDFSVNAESAMHNYRGDFKQAFEKSGFDGLMAKVKALQAKLDADLAHGSRTAP